MREVVCPACGALSEGEDEQELVTNARAHTWEAHHYLVPEDHVLTRAEEVAVQDVSGFFLIAATDRERLAVISPDGSRITYGELATRVNRISNALRELGLKSGDRMSVLLRNDVACFELVLAASQIGVIEVPVNWHLSEPEVAYIVADSGSKVLVAGSEFAARHGALADLPDLDRFVVGDPVEGWRPYSGLRDVGDGHPPRDRVFGQVMGYTSGTTGRPKGVYRRSEGVAPDQGFAPLIAFITLFGVGADGVNLVCSPLYHSAPFSFALAGLHVGNTLVILDGFDAELVLRTIDKYGVTTSHMVPTHFHRMLGLPPETRARYNVSTLESLVHAGAPCPVHLKRAMIEWVGPILWEYLGATEGIVAIAPPSDFDIKPGSVGRVDPDAILMVNEDEGGDGAESAAGEAGTIYFRTSAPYEYLNAPEKTAESRRGDFVTVGDVGYIDEDGYLFTLDRRTDLILSGGVNVYPAEIESHLLEHPAVADVCVIGVPDDEWGQRVVAVVQPKPGRSGDALTGELAEFMERVIASYKRPRQIELCDELPRTAAGKLQRRLVRALYVPS